MHASWRNEILKKIPADAQLHSLSVSHQIEKILKISDEKIFNYPDPLQWLIILDDVDLHQFMLNLGAFCLASTIKCVVLKQQVADLKAMLGADLYMQILNNDMNAIAKIYDGLFRESLPKSEMMVSLTSEIAFYQAACQLLAVVFVDQPLFFKIRLALRLPYESAQVLSRPMPLPVLPAENAMKLRQLLFQLLDKVSEQWRSWLA